MIAPIRILHAFSTFDMGGPQSRFVTLHKELGEEFEHIVVAMDGNYGAAQECDIGLCNFLDVTFCKGFGLGNRKIIQSLIASINPHVIISYNWGAIEWPLFASLKTKRIHVEEGFSSQEQSKQFARRIWLRRLLFALRSPELVVVSSQLSDIAANLWYTPLKKIHFIPNGVDTQRFTPSNSRRTFLQSIGIASGLRPEKRIDRLLHAFALLKNGDLSLKIAGDGPMRAELEKISIELGIERQIEFLGHLSSTEFFYKNIDCFVLCSDTEQAPFSLLEAMASGIPCVVTRVGDMPIMLPEKNKQWICETTAESLAEKISDLCTTELHEYGKANRKHVLQNYSIEKMHNQWASLLRTY